MTDKEYDCGCVFINEDGGYIERCTLHSVGITLEELEKRFQKKMYLDILLEDYAQGYTFSNALGSSCNAGRVASEIVGKFRTFTTSDGDVLPLLQAAVSIEAEDEEVADGRSRQFPVGVSFDGWLSAEVQDGLERAERGERIGAAYVQSLLAALRHQLHIAKNIDKLKSQLKQAIQSRQVEVLLSEFGPFANLLRKALKAATERNQHEKRRKKTESDGQGQLSFGENKANA